MPKKKPFPLVSNFRNIEPLTTNQQRAINDFKQGRNLILSGMAGTGKTFIALATALQYLYDKNNPCNQLIIIRPAVATEDVGFLPGTYEEKISPYEEVYTSMFEQLYKTTGNYEHLKDCGFLTFMNSSFVRGRTYDDAVIVVDEYSNMNFHQIDSCITRTGENSRIIFSGDFNQSDLKETAKRNNDFEKFMGIMKMMEEQFSVIDFGIEDIVRSDLVKQYLTAKERYESARTG